MPRRSKRQLERDVDAYLRSPAAPGYTVLVKNSVLGSAKYVGSFPTEEDATLFAQGEAARSRKFASYELWTGSAHQPGKFVRDLGSGTH
jgi:hypothetical protein